MKRLFVKVTRDSLPQVKDRYPFIYLERGRLEVDDSSVKWIDSEGHVVAVPVATISALLLGPGTSVTHDAIRTAASANCCLCWVGEDSLLFYAAGFVPTAHSRNFLKQVRLSATPKTRVEIARKMFLKRFPDEDLGGKTLQEMQGMEGRRVRSLYNSLAQTYSVGWKGRSYTPGKMQLADVTNRVLSSCNAALYGITCSVVHSMGYSPHAGFIHSGSSLPFVYDIADLYKSSLCIDLAFSLTRDLAGKYEKSRVADAFRKRVLEEDLMRKMARDIQSLLA